MARIELALTLPILMAAACGSAREGGADASGGGHDGTAGLHDGATTDTSGQSGIDAAMGESGTPAHLQLYSGDGTMVLEQWPGGDPLKVLVTDANNVPVANATVSWQTTSGFMAVTGNFATGLTGTSLSDTNGLARVGLRGEGEAQEISSYPSTINASIAGVGSVDFHVMSTYWAPGLPSPPETYLSAPAAIDLGTFPAGSIATGAIVSTIQYTAGDQAGHMVAAIGMRLVDNTNTASDFPPAVACANATETLAGGTVFSDATGHGTCDLRIPTTPGQYTFGVRVGGSVDFAPFFVTAQ